MYESEILKSMGLGGIFILIAGSWSVNCTSLFESS